MFELSLLLYSPVVVFNIKRNHCVSWIPLCVCVEAYLHTHTPTRTHTHTQQVWAVPVETTRGDTIYK